MEKGVGKVALVGPGAVGGYYGSMLAIQRHDVHFLFRSTFDAVQSEGLWLVHHAEGGRKELSIPFAGTFKPESIGICDWVIVATKATANSELADTLRPLLGKKTNLLTLQNGMGNVENLALAFGATAPFLPGSVLPASTAPLLM